MMITIRPHGVSHDSQLSKALKVLSKFINMIKGDKNIIFFYKFESPIYSFLKHINPKRYTTTMVKSTTVVVGK